MGWLVAGHFVQVPRFEFQDWLNTSFLDFAQKGTRLALQAIGYLDWEEAEVEQAAPDTTADTSVQGLLKQLKRLQRSQHTLDLARSIFEDVRVRQLGFMPLD